MDTKCKAQDAIRCELCDTNAPHMHCEICHINVCKACMIDHLSDESKDHTLVTFNKRRSTITYPICQKHANKIYELHCKQCNISMCLLCVFTGDHEQHVKIDILEQVRVKKDSLRRI